MLSNYLDFCKLTEPLLELKNCMICPHECNVNRFSEKLGFCKSRADFNISSICIHRGEEPPISGSHGICNIFFTNCNMQCVYCQNYQISKNIPNRKSDSLSLECVLKEIIGILDRGINILGFVSPSHFIPQMKIIIHALNELGYYPKIVYNSNGYDKVEQLREIEYLVDVYLPDLKYADSSIGYKLSRIKNYPKIAFDAIQEMYRQKGSLLLIDERGYAERGLLIRHLVLPGFIKNSKDVLQWIASELSVNVSISLMSQYYPTVNVSQGHILGRTLKAKEYEEVVNYFYEIGLSKGWVQSLDSHEHYRPDFNKFNHPFE